MTASNMRKIQRDYFDMLAEIGVTKHLGSLSATDDMLNQCHIDENSLVLDVGCGIGLTPCYIVKKYNCRVIGVDLMPKMIKRANQEAKRRRVTEHTEFLVADAQNLPFPDSYFDAVIIESVNVFITIPLIAFREYVRITKPGSYVGMNESTWLEPPSQKAVEYFRTIGATIHQKEEWGALMSAAGLERINAQAYKLNLRQEAKGRYQRFGLKSLLLTVYRAIKVLLRDSYSRNTLKSATQQAPGLVADILGYGVYVGKKPA